MKKLIRKSFGSVLLTGILTTASLQAQTAVISTNPVASMGLITEFQPEMMIIKTENGTAPVHYSYNKTTTYVDEEGNPVSIQTIKSGLPVTVYYIKSGDSMLATKVVVRKSVVVPSASVEEKKTTTTTTETK